MKKVIRYEREEGAEYMNIFYLVWATLSPFLSNILRFVFEFNLHVLLHNDTKTPCSVLDLMMAFLVGKSCNLRKTHGKPSVLPYKQKYSRLVKLARF